jgi:hypothetical protein
LRKPFHDLAKALPKSARFSPETAKRENGAPQRHARKGKTIPGPFRAITREGKKEDEQGKPSMKKQARKREGERG